MAAAKVDGVMVGRGALTKPWIFQEYARREAWEPDVAQRIEVYRRLTGYMKVRRPSPHGRCNIMAAGPFQPLACTRAVRAGCSDVCCGGVCAVACVCEA
eukprot:4551444-Prymnesium_polylepis.1